MSSCSCLTVLSGPAWLLHNKICTPLASLCIYQNGTLALQSTKNRNQCYASPCTRITLNIPFLLTRTGNTLAHLEQTSLAPKVVGRIVELNSDVSTNNMFSLSNPFSHIVLIRYFFLSLNFTNEQALSYTVTTVRLKILFKGRGPPD